MEKEMMSVMKYGRLVAVVVSMWLVVGCEQEKVDTLSPEAPVVPLPEAEREAEEKEAPEEAEPWVPEAAAFLGWPGQGEGRTFGLTWLGGDEELDLLAEPEAEAAVVGPLRWYDGEELDWRESRVVVEKPRALSVVEPVVFYGMMYDVEYMEIEAEGREVELEVDEVVYFYHVAGEGQCFLGIGGEVYYGECPAEALRPAEELDPGAQMLTPLRAQWWVLISEAVEGWMEVMEAPLEVYSREIEGVERPDTGDEY